MPRSTPLSHGDITIYKIPGAPIPIVHRVIETHNEYGAPHFPAAAAARKVDQKKIKPGVFASLPDPTTRISGS